jgi:alpha-mannosidase
VKFDRKVGLRRLVWLPTKTVLLRDAGDLLVIQADRGSFQIEDPCGAEVPATSGDLKLSRSTRENRVILSGAFPSLDWLGPDASLRWAITFTLDAGRPALDLAVRLEWKGEAARVRLKLATELNTGSALFEVPFGVVERRAYTPRANAKGEWPAQRWVALEAGHHGLALANTGAAGVEALGGTLFTTLLRAPQSEYVGLVADDSSSQHGNHTHRFALIPYAGSWSQSGVIRLAQELNHPPRLLAAGPETAVPGNDDFRIDGDSTVVFSCLKPADDGSGQAILRCYETAGRPASVRVKLRGLTHAWSSDLREQQQAPIPVENGEIRLKFRPFEIVTVRLDSQSPSRKSMETSAS